jgi:hypothetical protein
VEILVLGDSLSFGRPNYGICRDKTWPYLLQRKLNGLLCMRARGGSTSFDVLAEAKSLSGGWFGSGSDRPFDVAFVQVGIVDATPRLLPKKIFSYAFMLPGSSRLLRSRFLHQSIARPWVATTQFIENVANINSLLKHMANQVLFIEVARPDHYLIENVGDFSGSIVLRNKLLAESIGEDQVVACWGGLAVPQFLLPDGHHLNELGHQEVFKHCLNRLL